MADAPDKAKIDPAVEAYFRMLPEADYPAALIDKYPRIATHIYTLRGSKAALKEHFESLLTDNRGGRQGFPFSVIVNIQTLYDSLIGIPDGFHKTGKFFVATHALHGSKTPTGRLKK